MTQTGWVLPSSAMVRSKREVLPDPGELIRFSAVMPRWANQSRLCWARWSFLARIASPMIRFSVIAVWGCGASVECELC